MSIPPFPSQDLAKLVLGYLAEEQLMTAYDEFLQASPYLDALRNEYDRIFMTSLRSILAEYRAVKICVETCSPFLLRKKLFQCHSLLEMVKFLISNVDINKLKDQDAAERTSYEKQNSSSISKSYSCEECSSSKLTTCVCKSKQMPGCDSQNTDNIDTSQNSIETTPLTDLPGNYVTNRRKHVKVLDRESNINSGQSSGISNLDAHSSNGQPGQGHFNHGMHSRNQENTVIDVDQSARYEDLHESRQKLEEFNDVLKSVTNKQNMMPMSSFQSFETGVSDGENQNINVPDSSTENMSSQTSVTKENYNNNVKGPPNSQILLQANQLNEKIDIQACRSTSYTPHQSTAKSEDHKIRILSDVKVGTKFHNKFKDNSKRKSALLKNATSTPLTQMQKIVINGALAYNRNPVSSHNYTKDEIMAMPTLIVVPPSAQSGNSTSVHSNPIMSQNCEPIPSPQILGPLVIDVPSSPPPITELDNDLKITASNKTNQKSTGLIKTVDATKNATVPKDNGTTVTAETNTPQGLPPVRRSSSTPRRTSHVRVLDFTTTPRRILHSNISEEVTQGSHASVEVVVSGNPNVTHTLTTAHTQLNQNTIVTFSASASHNIECIEINDPPKENKTINLVKPIKKNNWDADLRALAIASDLHSVTSIPVPKKISKKKKSTEDKKDSSKTNDKKANESKISPKIKKKSKKKKKIEEDDDQSPELLLKSDHAVKPNINIIIGNDSKTAETVDEVENVPDNIEDTPEGERLSLQNVIGAKLNISDLLETPYKQALYDIQMETPRFLGPDLPDEPVSDIKIMNIPTPRFLNTPKGVQATPSSYSSRPTDYSSGGSYYKPDDQDYVLIPEIGITEKSTNDSVGICKDNSETKAKDKKQNDVKKSRPVRQCTRNVSYRSARLGNKIKDVDDTTDTASSCSEPQNQNTLEEGKHSTLKTPRVKSKFNNNKSDTKKRNSTIKLQKSPLVQDKTKFINMKPRQTPIKLTPSGRRKIGETSCQRKKRANTKDKNLNSTPLINCVPTKSRRKSSTPRKLHCTKSFNAATAPNPGNTESVKNKQTPIPIDSDTEQIALRWSDDGSQDTKGVPSNVPANDAEDITQIKEFIESSRIKTVSESDSSFKASLVRRGFDLETAKSIERDLLDGSEEPIRSDIPPISVEIVENKKEMSLEKTLETDSSVTNELQIVQDDVDESEEIELSAYDCDESSNNYYVIQHDDMEKTFQGSPVTLKDKFSMEVCIDEELTVRLRANPFKLMFELDPIEEINYNRKETELAVSSICNMDKLYTPIKDSFKSQYYEIFDSTLTSLDTPLKANSPKNRDNDVTVTDIVLESEKNESKPDTKKRKRSQSSPDTSNVDYKKSKNETQIDIKNIDIESVLTKLHGH